MIITTTAISVTEGQPGGQNHATKRGEIEKNRSELEEAGGLYLDGEREIRDDVIRMDVTSS